MAAAERPDPYDAAREALETAAELCSYFPAMLAALENAASHRDSLLKEESLRFAVREAVDQLEAASSWIYDAENYDTPRD